MNLAGISYLTFSHILTTYPSPAKHNNCSKTNTILLPPGGGGHNFQQSPTIYTIEARLTLEPHSYLLSIPAPPCTFGQDDLIFPPNTTSHPHLDIQHTPSIQQTLWNCDPP